MVSNKCSISYSHNERASDEPYFFWEDRVFLVATTYPK